VSSRESIEELVYQSCLLMDDADYDGYMGLCEPEFHYTITTFSPEIRKDMVWLEHDRNGLQTLLKQLPRHNSDHSPLARHATVYTVRPDGADNQAEVVSALQVFKTALDGGATELFAVGKYIDTVRLNGDGPKLLKRTVKLDTRMLGIGYHVPF
jgi:methanesulfonate monooxygenase small subunit